MRKLILKCGLSPGDIIMLTAAVRDLHHWYSGQFLTDVRTSTPVLWENNPYISPLSETDPEVEVLDCSYPLINQADQTPYHCLHGFIDFLNQRLKLVIRPTAFKGDIHLAPQEKAWYSQVHELTSENTPFWIVVAGGKYDVTIKWWHRERYQAVIDHFDGKLQFVQVGELGHHHPALQRVIDLRGKTTFRELIRLVYHSQGVLCPVTAMMHLAAAVEVPPGRPARRPCVVVAGGREPAHWEAYPGHQFIHTNGALACSQHGGCWKDRVSPLRDGDERDRPERLCLQPVGPFPRCLELITPAMVIDRIESYFQGGALRYLSPRQQNAARRAVRATARNRYDLQPLNLSSAGMACDAFTRKLGETPRQLQGRGIVIAGGGIRYFTCAWVCLRMLRRLGCRLPVEFWHLGPQEMDQERRRLLAGLDVRCVDACKVRKKFPARLLHGWELKPYAILHSCFREVLFLDADNVPVLDPTFLFDTPQFRTAGAVFWPDYASGSSPRAKPIWRSCGLRPPKEPEFESGQMLFDKQRCWRALRLALWFNENSDFYYQYLHGDKETFHLAFRKLKQPYALVPHPVLPLPGTMCQHDFDGRRLFQHRNSDKWDLLLHNRIVPGFQFEQECRHDVMELRQRWDGGVRLANTIRARARTHRGAARLRLEAAILIGPGGGCNGQTFQNLAHTDWSSPVLKIKAEPAPDPADHEYLVRCVHQALKQMIVGDADYVLLLEGNLEFNRYLAYNLLHWPPLRERRVTLASLYNPRLREMACDIASNARILDPRCPLPHGALLVSRETANHLVRYWHRAEGPHPLRMARLAGRLKQPVYYHAPSLVQKVRRSADGERPTDFAIDFNPAWRA